ncbi:hypothetical protein FACS1894156_1270 [Bacteroidia bacterium]|nr:hypothetical protein FACS1894156_1270 [Bacteroidia bacterium]
MKKLFLEYKHDACFWTYFAIIVLSLFALPLLSKPAGMSGDEPVHMAQAEHVVRWYQTLGKDTLAVVPTSKDGNLREYGQTFDNFACWIATIFHIEDILSVRHTVNAIGGWIGILFASLLAYRVRKKWLAAIITAVLLFFSPRYLGHSFNNLKDVPFAAMMMMGLYYIFRFLQTFPKPPLKICVMLAVSIGLAIGTRVGGLLLVAFFGLFGLCYLVNEWYNQKQNNVQNMGKQKAKVSTPFPTKLLEKMLLYGLIIAVAGYVLAVLLWPFALVGPIKNVMFAWEQMSHFKMFLRQLFEGQQTWSDLLPWYYTPKYILITIPIAVLIGAIVYLFVGGLSKGNRFSTFIVYFAFIFPVFWIVYSNANVYGGWRHSMFVYPPMAVAAGLGFCALVDMAKNKYVKMALTALPFLLLLNPIIFTVKNHPYEYVYFNRFVGGIKGAYGNYEMDYYYHSTREASDWIQKDVQQNGTPDSTRKIKIVTWHVASVQYFFRHDTADFSVNFSRWYERGFNDWDYGVFNITGMLPELLKNKKAFPPANTAYQIKADGVPICIVLKRSDKSDYYGHAAMKENRVEEAIAHLQQALVYDAYNEQALEDLISIYSQIGMPDSALILAQRWAAFNKGNTTALNKLSNLYFAKGDFSNALLTANSIIKYNSRDISGLWIAANVYAKQNKLDNALRTLQRLLNIRGDYRPAYELMAQIYEQTGNPQQAQKIRDAMR